MKEFKLENHPKISTGFSVPENYFDDFQTKLLQQLHCEKSKVINLHQKRKKLLVAVAATLILAMSLPIYYHFLSTSQELDHINLENYLAYQPNITQYDLIGEIETDDLLTLNETTITDHTAIEEHLLKEGNLEQLILE